MNKAALANFLRHLLFLFVILELVSGVILITQSRTCEADFMQKPLLPLNLDPKIFHSIGLAINLSFTVFNCLGFMITVTSIVGFLGTMYLHSHQLINFAAGVAFLLAAPAELINVIVLDKFVDSFDLLINDQMTTLFKSSAEFTTKIDRWETKEVQDLFKVPYVDDWSPNVTGDATSHSYIDYIHFTHNCCGLTGRFFWEVPIPRSCCSPKYKDDACTTMVANPGQCLQGYSQFESCMIGLEIQNGFFLCLSLATAFVSLYLARLKIKYPNEVYRSDFSSSDEDETSFFTS